MCIYICTHNLIQRLVWRKAAKKKKTLAYPHPASWYSSKSTLLSTLPSTLFRGTDFQCLYASWCYLR